MAPLTEDRLQNLRHGLEQRAAALSRDVREVQDEHEGVPTLTQPDTVDDDVARGEQRTRTAVRDAERYRDAAELNAIDAALARMRDGSYGECVDCGVDIGLERLLAQPAAARCIECQARHERAHPELPAAPRAF